ncbi:MAG: toll/interleukin-1 receptor domain-containing protein [Bacteroidota bacterium]
MALIPGYEYDIFISYVHADNASETDSDEGWVDQFYKYLDTKLNKHSEEIKIWWDSKNLDRSEVFDDSIEEAINKSALMICLHSRRYSQSEYCIKELDHFHQKAQEEPAGLVVGNRSRVLNVLLSNIHYSEWPEKLQGTSGFPFHDGGDYGDPLKVSSDGPFGDQMKELRNALVRIFEDFNKTPEKPEKKKDAFTIHLAEVNDSLMDRRDGIIARLNAEGYEVSIGDPSVSEVNIHQNKTEEAFQTAQLAVHLLGEFPGKKIIGDLDSRYIQKEVEIGLESSTPQLLWLPSDLEIKSIENEGHRAFLQSIEAGTLSSKSIEFIRSNEAELLNMILDAANRLKRNKLVEIKQDVSESDDLKVLLDTHIDDYLYAFNLKKNLVNNDIKLIFNPEDGDPQENIEILYSNISEAQKYIFLYGNEENNEWVDVRVKNTMKKLVEDDRYNQNIFIYLTPPQKETTDIRVAQSPMVKIVDNSANEQIDPLLFTEFLSDLKAKTG